MNQGEDCFGNCNEIRRLYTLVEEYANWLISVCEKLETARKDVSRYRHEAEYWYEQALGI
jgi:secreted trypsin-like serine protease